eukprot:6181851-Pleurochrysis_carterae.AAC.2
MAERARLIMSRRIDRWLLADDDGQNQLCPRLAHEATPNLEHVLIILISLLPILICKLNICSCDKRVCEEVPAYSSHCTSDIAAATTGCRSNVRALTL